LTGGGTGGHIYPALAIADLVTELRPGGIRLGYAGQPDGMEAELVGRRRDITFLPVRAAGMPRRLFGAWPRFVWRNTLGFYDAWHHIERFAPDLVVATGGFVTSPTLMVAKLRGIPYVMHEQNAVLGLTNRMFAGSAACVFLTYPLRHTLPSRTELVGNPVRAEFRTAFAGPNRFRCAADEFIVLVVGGSRGAQSLNRAVTGLGAWLAQRPQVRLLHITGTRDFAAVNEARLHEKQHIVLPFLHEMREAFAAADLLVSRSGATVLAEIGATGRPAILVPYPHATDNHQEKNARALVEMGAAEMVLDHELTPERLGQAIDALLADPARRTAMAEASARSRPADVETRIREILRAWV